MLRIYDEDVGISLFPCNFSKHLFDRMEIFYLTKWILDVIITLTITLSIKLRGQQLSTFRGTVDFDDLEGLRPFGERSLISESCYDEGYC
jgi:hypothetical protein